MRRLKSVFWVAIPFFLFLCFAGAVYFDKVLPRYNRQYPVMNGYTNTKVLGKELPENVVLQQTFTLPKPAQGLDVHLSNLSFETTGKTIIKLKQTDTGQEIFEYVIANNEIPRHSPVSILSPQPLMSKTEYVLSIKTSAITNGAVAPYLVGTVAWKGDMTLGGRVIPHTSLAMDATASYGFFYTKLFWLIALMEVIGTGLICLLAFVKKTRLEIIVCAAILMLGSIYSILIVPNTVPDESVHIATAYRYSSALLNGEWDMRSAYSIRQEDNAFQEYRLLNSPAQYAHFAKTILRPAQDTQHISSPPIEPTGIPVLYIPTTLGMTLGRLLRLSHTSVLYLARFCNLIVYTAFVYLGLKKLSFYKGIIAVTALLPIMLQQAMSCSYDGTILACGILFLSYALELILGSSRFTKWDIIILCITGAILASAKYGAYAPILLLCLLIPKRRENLPYHRKCIFFSVIGSAATLYLMMSVKNMLSVLLNERLVAGAPAGETNFTIATLLQSPFAFIGLCIRTLLNIKDDLFLEMLGNDLASYTLSLSVICLCGFFLLLILSMLSGQEKKIEITPVQKVSFGVIIVMVVGVFFAASYMWTTLGATQLWGIQGRYFLPLWPLILLLFASPKITLTQNIDKPLVVAACALNSFVVLQLLASVA